MMHPVILDLNTPLISVLPKHWEHLKVLRMCHFFTLECFSFDGEEWLTTNTAVVTIIMMHFVAFIFVNMHCGWRVRGPPPITLHLNRLGIGFGELLPLLHWQKLLILISGSQSCCHARSGMLQLLSGRNVMQDQKIPFQCIWTDKNLSIGHTGICPVYSSCIVILQMLEQLRLEGRHAVAMQLNQVTLTMLCQRLEDICVSYCEI